MSNYPMVTEVNCLIGDRLAAGGEIHLPGVGSLYTERCAAKRISVCSQLGESTTFSFIFKKANSDVK